MKLTRILALLLTIACVPATLAEETPEEYHITMYVETRASPYNSTADTIIGQIIKEKFNIVLDFEIMGQDWNEFINQKLVSQDFPEIALLRWDFVGANWVNGGGALELDELFANAENIKTLNKSRLPLWRMADPTGENRLLKWTYAGGLDEAVGPRNDILVRSDVLKALGYPKLHTFSDYIDFLKKAMEMFPTDHEGNQTIGMCVPFAEPWGVNMINIAAEKASFSGCTQFPTMYNCAEDLQAHSRHRRAVFDRRAVERVYRHDVLQRIRPESASAFLHPDAVYEEQPAFDGGDPRGREPRAARKCADGQNGHYGNHHRPDHVRISAFAEILRKGHHDRRNQGINRRKMQ